MKRLFPMSFGPEPLRRGGTVTLEATPNMDFHLERLVVPEYREHITLRGISVGEDPDEPNQLEAPVSGTRLHPLQGLGSFSVHVPARTPVRVVFDVSHDAPDGQLLVAAIGEGDDGAPAAEGEIPARRTPPRDVLRQADEARTKLASELFREAVARGDDPNEAAEGSVLQAEALLLELESTGDDWLSAFADVWARHQPT